MKPESQLVLPLKVRFWDILVLSGNGCCPKKPRLTKKRTLSNNLFVKGLTLIITLFKKQIKNESNHTVISVTGYAFVQRP